MTKVTINKTAKTITIVMPLLEPKASASGKTMLLSTTGRSTESDGKWEDKDIQVNCSVYFKP